MGNIVSATEIKSSLATSAPYNPGVQRPKPLIVRAYKRIFPQAFDMVSSVLYLGALGLYFYDGLMGSSSRRLELVSSIVVVLAICCLVTLERWEHWFYNAHAPSRVSATIFVTRMALIEVVAQLDNFSFSPFLYLVIPFSGFLYKGMKLCYWLAGLVLVVYLVKLTIYSPDWYNNEGTVREFLIFLMGLLFVMTMAHVVEKEQQSRARSETLLAQLEESHTQLRAYTEQIGELATIKERNRLARDIHDSLGHYLTVINVQLEKALAFKETRPEEAARAVDDAKRLASEALRDVRRSVGALRAGPETEAFMLKRSLDELVGHTASADLHIDLKLRGSEEGFAGQSLMALYRAAQEGLTNVRKHSGASTARIEVEFGSDTATLRLTDNGHGLDPNTGHNSGGYGLQGLKERVELLGGTFWLESAPGSGLALCVSIPKEGRPRTISGTVTQGSTGVQA